MRAGEGFTMKRRAVNEGGGGFTMTRGGANERGEGFTVMGRCTIKLKA